MKFVMSLVLAATFATPALASEKETTTVDVKNREAIKFALTAAKNQNKQEMNEEERTRGANAYRLEDLQDPNVKSSDNKKSWSVSPWFGDKRGRLLTPYENRRELEQGRNTTFAPVLISEVPRAYGAKLKIKFGAKQ